MTRYWYPGVPTRRATFVNLAVFFAILAGYYMCPSDLPYASWLVRAARTQQPPIEGKTNLTEAKHGGDGDLNVRPNEGSVEGHEIQESRVVEAELDEFSHVPPEPNCVEPRNQREGSDIEHKHSRFELERQIVTHQKEISALETKFLTEYGLLEDEVEELRTSNNILRDDIAQASANVEGLKMQMEATETANESKLGLLRKLETEQAEYNKLEDDRDYLKEAMDALSKDLNISQEGQHALQRENCELKKLLARHEGKQCGCASTDQSQEADRTIREEQGLEIVHMDSSGGERGSESPVDPGNPVAVEFRGPEVEGATNPSRFISNASLRLRGHTSWTEQGCDGHDTRIGDQNRLIRHISERNSMSSDENLDDHPLSNVHQLKTFHEKVAEMQTSLAKHKRSDSKFCAAASLSKLLADLDLLHQMSLGNEDRSWNDDILHDTPAHSATGSVIGDVYEQERHDIVKNYVGFEEQHDTQNLVGGSSLSDIVGCMENGQSVATSNVESVGRASSSPPTGAIAHDKTLGNPKAPGAKTKLSKMRRWSSQSKAFLTKLHGPHASTDGRGSSMRTSSSYSLPKEPEH